MESRARRISHEFPPMSFLETQPPTARSTTPSADAGRQLTLDLDAQRPIERPSDLTSGNFDQAAAEGAKTAVAIVTELRTASNPQQPLDPAWLSLKSMRGRRSTLNELIEAVGEDAALKLIRAFGGTRLYVPHSPEANDLLASTIGYYAATRLARIYGGDRVDVPNPPPRRIRIMQLRASGMSVDAIARELRCTRRRVFQVLAEARDSDGPE